jgi:hypothetical protein
MQREQSVSRLSGSQRALSCAHSLANILAEQIKRDFVIYAATTSQSV